MPDTVTVNNERVQKFVDALRSDEYTKVEGALCMSGEGGQQMHCALGVGCDVFAKETGVGRWRSVEAALGAALEFNDGHGNRSSSSLPQMVVQWYGFSSDCVELIDKFGNRCSVIDLNDDGARDPDGEWCGPASYEEIAQALERTYLDG